MATAAQIRAAVDTEVLARIQGKAIDRYSLQDGRSVQKSPLAELLRVREHYAAQAIQEEFGSAIAGFRFFEP
jgi:hypothetical protein